MSFILDIPIDYVVESAPPSFVVDIAIDYVTQDAARFIVDIPVDYPVAVPKGRRMFAQRRDSE